MNENENPIVWSIAGGDPSSGAGLQGDILTLQSLGVYPCSVLTTLIAQGPNQVYAAQPVHPDFVNHQVRVLLDDLPPPAAIKIGLLGSEEILRVLLPHLRSLSELGVPIVLDPVLSASAGFEFLRPEIWPLICTELLPVLRLLTPNLPETSALLKISELKSDEDFLRAAHLFLEMGTHSVLLKGGHGTREDVRDLFASPESECWLSSPRIITPNRHGTGCVLSSAIAAAWALGFDDVEAVVKAKAVVNTGLKHGRYGTLARNGWNTDAGNVPVMEGV